MGKLLHLPCPHTTLGVLQNILPPKANSDWTHHPVTPRVAIVPKGMCCCIILHRTDHFCTSTSAFSPKTRNWVPVSPFQPALLTSKKVLSVALVGLWVIRNLMFL